jgi:glycosyltransferase involved in cell wall biosynthesis
LNQSNSDPSVSVVIPLFNKEKEVLRAVNSVLSQTISDFEIIVVNDGSTDKGPDLVRVIKDLRIKVIDQENSGVSSARNLGIAESRAELIAFLDADDEWKADFLETIYHLKNKFPSCEMFATNYVFRRTTNLLKDTVIRGLPKGFKEGILTGYFKIASQSDPPIWSSAVAVKKRALESVGNFPVGITSGEDLVTWAKLASKYQIAYALEPKAYFYEPEILNEHPRVPQMPDIIGQQLNQLLEKDRHILGLREYISLWHKMRANIFIRLRQQSEARREILKALRYSKTSMKLYLLFLLTLLPANSAKQIFKLFKVLQEAKLSRSSSN